MILGQYIIRSDDELNAFMRKAWEFSLIPLVLKHGYCWLEVYFSDTAEMERFTEELIKI